MTTELRTLRCDDPACAGLQASGHTVVARSWGANLDPHDPPTAMKLRAAVERGHGQRLTLHELTSEDADVVAAVEHANHRDYPQGPATRHEDVTTVTFTTILATGSRAWGGTRDGRLIAVAVASPKGPAWWDITFASVLAEHRRTGVGQAVVAALILALRADGADRISTGGAASNDASRGAALALGAILEPEWRTYAPPG